MVGLGLCLEDLESFIEEFSFYSQSNSISLKSFENGSPDLPFRRVTMDSSLSIMKVLRFLPKEQASPAPIPVAPSPHLLHGHTFTP